MKKAATQWEISSSPLVPESAFLQVYRLLIISILNSPWYKTDFITSSPLVLFMWDTDSAAQLRNKICREKKQHTNIYKDFKCTSEQSLATLRHPVRKAKIPAMKFSKLVLGS